MRTMRTLPLGAAALWLVLVPEASAFFGRQLGKGLGARVGARVASRSAALGSRLSGSALKNARGAARALTRRGRLLRGHRIRSYSGTQTGAQGTNRVRLLNQAKAKAAKNGEEIRGVHSVWYRTESDQLIRVQPTAFQPNTWKIAQGRLSAGDTIAGIERATWVTSGGRLVSAGQVSSIRRVGSRIPVDTKMAAGIFFGAGVNAMVWEARDWRNRKRDEEDGLLGQTGGGNTIIQIDGDGDDEDRGASGGGGGDGSGDQVIIIEQGGGDDAEDDGSAGGGADDGDGDQVIIIEQGGDDEDASDDGEGDEPDQTIRIEIEDGDGDDGGAR